MWMLIWDDVDLARTAKHPRYRSKETSSTYRGFLPLLILFHKVSMDTILLNSITILECMSMTTFYAFTLSIGTIPIHALYGEISGSIDPRMI